MTRRKWIALSICLLVFGGIVLWQSGDPTVAALQKKEPDPKDVPPDGLAFVIKPYLQFPTQTSIVIMWETTKPGTALVEYGLANTALLGKAMSETPATIHEVTLKDLQPQTRYIYRVTITDAEGKKLVSPLLTFMTAVDESAAYSFTIIGDTQKNPTVTGTVAKLMWERRPNFVIHVGDVVDNGADKKEWVNELFGPASELFSRVAVFPTIGNHEKNHAHYYKYFSLPKPEYYYSYRYGNADFFVLDTNKTVKPDSEQFKWLDAELAKSKAMWKFVYHHHPAYTSDDNDYGDTWKGPGREGDLNVRSLVELYEKHRVDICFNGHIHLYERTWPLRGGKVDRKNGVIYITSGGGGGRLENFAPTPTWFKKQVRVDFHFCLVNIQGGSLELKAFDHKGQLFDTFELNK